MYKVKCFLEKWLNYIFAAIFAVYSICLFINSSNYFQVVPFSIVKVLLFAVCITGVLFFFSCIAIRSAAIKQFLKFHRVAALMMIMAALLIVQLFLVYTVYTPIGWDCSAVILQAATGKGFDLYFLRYPNNIFLCMVYRVLFCLVSALHLPQNYWLWADILNVFFIDAAIVMGAFICKRIFSIKTYYFFLLFSVLISGLSPYLTVPYSDTAGMTFSVAIFYCWLLYREAKHRRNKLLLGFLIGFLTAAGYFIKPTVLIVLIALAFYSLIHLKKPKGKPQLRQILSAALCTMFFLTGIGTAYAAKQKSDSVIYKEIFSRGVYTAKDEYLRQTPLTHHIMIGLKESKFSKGTQYGGFNMDDNLKTINTLGEDNKTALHLSVIKQRLSDFGVKGLLAHLYHKAVWVSTDGTFFYGGEGETDYWFHYKVNKSNSGLRGVLQNLTYAQTPFYQQYYANYQQALWLIILLFLSASFFVRSNGERGNIRFIFQLCIIGLLIFLLVFEARSRYLIVFLPFYLLLASDNLTELINLCHKKVRRNFDRHDGSTS